jgi:hypothetical protein
MGIRSGKSQGNDNPEIRIKKKYVISAILIVTIVSSLLASLDPIYLSLSSLNADSGNGCNGSGSIDFPSNYPGLSPGENIPMNVDSLEKAADFINRFGFHGNGGPVGGVGGNTRISIEGTPRTSKDIIIDQNDDIKCLNLHIVIIQEFVVWTNINKLCKAYQDAWKDYQQQLVAHELMHANEIQKEFTAQTLLDLINKPYNTLSTREDVIAVDYDTAAEDPTDRMNMPVLQPDNIHCDCTSPVPETGADNGTVPGTGVDTGQCVPACANKNQEYCTNYGQCIDVTFDSLNCGACGNKCAPGLSCENSVCSPTIPACYQDPTTLVCHACSNGNSALCASCIKVGSSC